MMGVWKKMRGSRTGKLLRLAFASLHSVILGMLFLVSFCFAWFTDDTGATFQIKTVGYEIGAAVSGNESGGYLLVSDGDGDGFLDMQLMNGQRYDICLEVIEEDVETSADHGFCVVSVGGKRYRTVPFGACGEQSCEVCGGKSRLSFSVEVTGNEAALVMKLFPYWGQYQYRNDIPVTEGLLVGESYLIVSPGDNMEEE